MVGWETSTGDVKYMESSGFLMSSGNGPVYDALRLSGWSLGATHDVAGKLSHAGGYSDAVYLDIRICPSKTVDGHLDALPENRYRKSIKQTVIGVGIQRRVYTRESSGLRPYAGLGAGLYYMRGTERSEGNQPNSSPSMFSDSLSDSQITVGGKLLLGVEHHNGLFVQGDATFLSDLSIGEFSGVSIPETAIGIHGGYRF